MISGSTIGCRLCPNGKDCKFAYSELAKNCAWWGKTPKEIGKDIKKRREEKCR